LRAISPFVRCKITERHALLARTASLNAFQDVLHPFLGAEIESRIEVDLRGMEEVDPGGEFLAEVAFGGFEDIDDALGGIALSRNVNGDSDFLHIRGDLHIGDFDPLEARVFEFVGDHLGQLETDRLGDAFIAAAFHNFDYPAYGPKKTLFY